MRKAKIILTLAASVLLCLPAAKAANPEMSEDGHTSYLFAGVQGGAQATMTNYDFSKLIMPYGAVYFGGYYNAVVGGRVHAMGFRSKGGFKSLDRSYYYNFYDVNADLLLNLSNLFWKNNSHFVNLVLVGGVGLNYAWHNKQAVNLTNTVTGLSAQCPNIWKTDRLGHNFRVGLQLDLDVAKHFGVNVEVDANNMNDRFNSKKANKDDWMLSAAVGVSYKFAYKSKARPMVPLVPAIVEKPKPAPAPAPAPKPVAKPAPAPAPAPAPVVKTMKEEIFYSIRSSQVSTAEWAKVERIVKFMKENPDATVDIVGYADAQTGNPTINMKYSLKRAEDLKKALTDKYGISASRISASAKGDTAQPFGENTKNRVSIITGTSKK